MVTGKTCCEYMHQLPTKDPLRLRRTDLQLAHTPAKTGAAKFGGPALLICRAGTQCVQVIEH
jgi:hypothetical protein